MSAIPQATSALAASGNWLTSTTLSLYVGPEATAELQHMVNCASVSKHRATCHDADAPPKCLSQQTVWAPFALS